MCSHALRRKVTPEGQTDRQIDRQTQIVINYRGGYTTPASSFSMPIKKNGMESLYGTASSTVRCAVRCFKPSRRTQAGTSRLMESPTSNIMLSSISFHCRLKKREATKPSQNGAKPTTATTYISAVNDNRKRQQQLKTNNKIVVVQSKAEEEEEEEGSEKITTTTINTRT